jgi:hypothetical protein
MPLPHRPRLTNKVLDDRLLAINKDEQEGGVVLYSHLMELNIISFLSLCYFGYSDPPAGSFVG